MAAAAEANFLPATELADTLVRSIGISFDAAHHLVSNAVRELIATGIGFDPDSMTAIVERELPSITTASPSITHDQIRDSLRAQNFVDVRTIPGGPSAVVLEPEILRARSQIALDQSWLEAATKHRQNAHALLRQQCDELLRSENVIQQ
jgi:argininosuccinate lyase